MFSIYSRAVFVHQQMEAMDEFRQFYQQNRVVSQCLLWCYTHRWLSLQPQSSLDTMLPSEPQSMSSELFLESLGVLFSRIIGFFVVERMVSDTIDGLLSSSEVPLV
jgi:hypothetical protein